MSFSDNAQDIRVDDGHILRARLPNNNGDLVDAEIDLDSCLGNNSGRFDWGGQGFSGSADGISFSVEGGANVPVLRAQLRDMNGDMQQTDVNLAERIGNNDGQFTFN